MCWLMGRYIKQRIPKPRPYNLLLLKIFYMALKLSNNIRVVAILILLYRVILVK